MTTLHATRERTGAPACPARSPSWSGLWHHVPLLAGIATFLLRVPSWGRPPGADEAGFLVVAGQWSGPGRSLYGGYWVDRPPLLITLFRLAGLHGGLETLRVLGALAAVLTVWGVARAATAATGATGAAGASGAAGSSRTSAAVASVLAAAWLVTPLTGSTEVNGELLAAPFVAWGIAAAVSGLRAPRAGTQRLGALAAGAAAASAVLVKQNFADVAVFSALALVVALVRREVAMTVAVRLATWFATGAGGALLLVAAWTARHGTSILAVLWAMYPFRVLAGQAIAASGNPAVTVRLGALVLRWVASGLGVVTLGAAVTLLRQGRRTSTVAIGLAGLVVFDVASILLGGSYWSHYLVQLVVPLAVLAGMVGTQLAPATQRRLGVILLAAATALAVGSVAAPAVASTPESQVGRAIASVAQPGDTITTLYGHSDVVQQSGLASPYPYLWSLPLKTLDPRLTELASTLRGPDAPTWVVVWAHLRSWGVQPDQVQGLLQHRYRVAAVLDGHTVWVRDDALRPAPVLPAAASR